VKLRIVITDAGADVLGPLGTVVMDVLWDGGPGTPSAIHRRANERLSTPRAFTTITTVLARLAASGMVTRDRKHQMWAASITREAFAAAVVERLRAALEQYEAVVV
jgi:predicted transcriptional regulator